MTAPALVDRFATGFQRTSIFRLTEGGFRWERSPGDDRVSPQRIPSPELRDALLDLHTTKLSFGLPEPVDGGLGYVTPGATSVAKLLQVVAFGEIRDHLLSAVRDTGRLLRRLHTTVAPELAPPDDSAALARLRFWLEHGDGPRAAGPLARRLRQRLGDDRWAAVTGWCDSFTADSADDVVLHGAPSTGSLVPSPAPGEAVLLAGEDVMRGQPEFDLGWLLGELLELRLPAASRQGDRPELVELGAVLLAGYGGEFDRDAVGRAAVLRILTHMHDFAAYVGWHPELLVYVDAMPGHIDSRGRAALCESERESS